MKARTATNRIIIHCAATPPGLDIGAATIRRWHVEGNGWADIGYHLVIRSNGLVEAGRPLRAVGAHVAGHNRDSVGVCLVGGIDEDNRPQANFSPAQWAALSAVVDRLQELYPGSVVLGHNELDPRKACPSFSVREWRFARMDARDMALVP